MAYKPTNNIQENIIHRNTIFDSQGMVSCCTCGNCIEKTEDASLTLTNFKSADPLINQQSIGATVIEFSDYMIPTGSFEYVLTPYSEIQEFNNGNISSTLQIGDGLNLTNLKFASSLVYYPFLKCNGTNTALPTNGGYWPISTNVNGLPTQTSKSYGSSFALSQFGLSNGISSNPIMLDSFLNLVMYANNIGGDDIIKNDSYFGSYVSNTYVNGSVFLFNYNNTELKDCFYNSHYCYECTNTKGDYYPWGNYLKKTIFDNNPPVRFNSYDFSTLYNFNIKSILTNGINPNFSRSLNSIDAFNYPSMKNIYFSSLSNIIGLNSYWLDVNNKKNDYTSWVSSGGASPCSEPQLQVIAVNNNYNIINYTTAKPYPTTVDIGDYQTYLSYIDTHEFSHLGFKSDAACANNISKLITPVYFKSFDDYSFSYTYANYTKTNSVFTITDKFIIPDFQTWEDCTSDPSTKLLPAKTVQLKEINSTDSIYKGGYVLDKFQINKDGTFNGMISILNNHQFYAVGLDATWNLETSPVYDGSQNCTYFSNVWKNKVSTGVYSTPLIQENAFIKAIPTTFINYSNQVQTGYYTNGEFSDYSLGIPVTYYEDICVGYIQQPDSLALPVSYVAQKTDRTKITSTTDASGKTTTTIRNVLWVGKTLLTNTYTHDSGSNRPNLASGKVPLTYNAILKGGFESDVIVSFQSKPICSIFNIVDELKRVTQFKVNFENYQKPPQQNFVLNDFTKDLVDATPQLPAAFTSLNFGTYYKSFDNIAFGIPNTNPNEYFYIQKYVNQFYQFVDWSLVKNIQEISPTFAYYAASAGRVYPDFGVPDRFKSCLLINGDADVWATGNEITFDIGITVYYSIYMEEIKDEKQTAGQSLIRIATTLQNANDGIYIPNVGLETQFKNKGLTVKFLSTHKDLSKLYAPRYDGFDPNSLSTANQNANDRGITYSVTGAFTTPVTQEINIRMNPIVIPPFENPRRLPSTYPLINFGYLMNYQAVGKNSESINKPYDEQIRPLSTYIDNQFFFYDRLEVISLSPLKLKYVNMKFVYNDAVDVKQYNLQYTPPNLTLINANGQCFWGFQCDIIMEEVVDEFIEEALPVEFNQILENVEYIQTSNLINSRTPMQMINPEQCEHIGKVIDRKNCNCPKKWVRLCDVHGKTDWKKCMQCKDFKMSE